MEGPLPAHKLCGFLFDSRCSISHSGFTNDHGLTLSPLGVPIDSSPDNARGRSKGCRFGMVKGSISIVRQLHSLVSNNFLQVVGVEVSKAEAVVVVVVLADVYLPPKIMTGWQFPRLRSVAAAVLHHLRCDWE